MTVCFFSVSKSRKSCILERKFPLIMNKAGLQSPGSNCRKAPDCPPAPANSTSLVRGKRAAAQGLGALPLHFWERPEAGLRGPTSAAYSFS